MFVKKDIKNIYELFPEADGLIDINKKFIYITKIDKHIFYGYKPSQLYEKLTDYIIIKIEKLLNKMRNAKTKEEYVRFENKYVDTRMIIDGSPTNNFVFDVFYFEYVFNTKIYLFK